MKGYYIDEARFAKLSRLKFMDFIDEINNSNEIRTNLTDVTLRLKKFKLAHSHDPNDPDKIIPKDLIDLVSYTGIHSNYGKFFIRVCANDIIVGSVAEKTSSNLTEIFREYGQEVVILICYLYPHLMSDEVINTLNDLTKNNIYYYFANSIQKYSFKHEYLGSKVLSSFLKMEYPGLLTLLKEIIINPDVVYNKLEALHTKTQSITLDLTDLYAFVYTIHDIYTNARAVSEFVNFVYNIKWDSVNGINSIIERYDSRFFKNIDVTTEIVIAVGTIIHEDYRASDKAFRMNDATEVIRDIVQRHYHNIPQLYDIMKAMGRDIAVFNEMSQSEEHAMYLQILEREFKNAKEMPKRVATESLDYHEFENMTDVEVYMALEHIIDSDIFISFNTFANEAIGTKTIDTKAVSKGVDAAGRAIYTMYRKFRDTSEVVASQVGKAANGIKRMLMGNPEHEVITGFNPMGVLKRLLATSAIFSVSKIAGVITLVVMFATRKGTKEAAKKKVLMDLNTEIEIVEEKINDARGDENKEAKYALMRVRADLIKARERVKYGLSAEEKVKAQVYSVTRRVI